MVIETHRRPDKLWVSLTMESYISKLYEESCKGSGRGQLRNHSTAQWPENFDFGPLRDAPGKHHALSRRYAGGLLYVVGAVRMESFPGAIVAAVERERWTLAKDTKLERFISYLGSTLARSPAWELFFGDWSDSGAIWFSG